MESERIEDLLCQTLEGEASAVEVYGTAIKCAVNDDLRLGWQRYLDETQDHLAIIRQVFAALGVDSERDTPGRAVVRRKGESLIQAMITTLDSDEPETAQLVAAEAVIDLENKVHANWKLIGRIAAGGDGELAGVLGDAHEQVEMQKDQHLYHAMGWARELWIEGLGLPAVLPPPEERRSVKTAIGASRAGQDREEMLGEPTGS